MHNPQRDWKQAVFCRYVNGDSVITQDFTYTMYRNKRGAGKFTSHMLYDLRKDPDENVNVVKEPAYQDVVNNIRKTLEQGWRPIMAQVSTEKASAPEEVTVGGSIYAGEGRTESCCCRI